MFVDQELESREDINATFGVLKNRCIQFWMEVGEREDRGIEESSSIVRDLVCLSEKMDSSDEVELKLNLALEIIRFAASLVYINREAALVGLVRARNFFSQVAPRGRHVLYSNVRNMLENTYSYLFEEFNISVENQETLRRKNLEEVAPAGN